jgi:hypothetical protein
MSCFLDESQGSSDESWQGRSEAVVTEVAIPGS